MKHVYRIVHYGARALLHLRWHNMRVWLIQSGEALPVDAGLHRRFRMSMLAESLLARGHEVLWWTSTFDHSKKRHRDCKPGSVTIRDRYALYLLNGIAYPRNVSIRRIINHVQLASAFRRQAVQEPAPDIVVTSLPTVELAAEAVRYATQRGIPSLVDIRDLWPDILLDVLPQPLRRLGRLALAPMFRRVRAALNSATGIIAISDEYLQWGLSYAQRRSAVADHIFPLGYPRTFFVEEDREALAAQLVSVGVDFSRRIALFVGTFGRTYDLDTVLEAARTLASSGDQGVQFVLVGDGDCDARWRSAARGLQNVVFTGRLNVSAISYLMSRSWVGLAAYAQRAPQSLPNKIFEYMSGGLPMLCSLGAETEQLLQKEEIGIRYHCAAELTTALNHLRRNVDIHASMRARCRALFTNRYTEDRVYPAYASHIEATVVRHANRALYSLKTVIK